MPNDARNKLRGMGGIMASSPELMQAAYQAGGSVRAPGSPNAPSPLPLIPSVAPMVPPAPGPRTSGYAPGLLPTGIVDPRLAASMRRAPTSPGRASRNSILENLLLQQRMGGALTAGGGARVDQPTPGMPRDATIPSLGDEGMNERALRSVMAGEGSMDDGIGLTVDQLMESSGAESFTVPEVGSTGPTGRGSEVDNVDNIDDLRAARGFGRSAYLSGLKGNVVDIPEDTALFDTTREDKAEVLAEVEQKLAEEEAKRPTSDTFASSDQERLIKNLETTKRRLESDVRRQLDEETPPEERVMSMPVEPTPLTQEQINKANKLAQKDPNFVFPETTDEPDTDDGDTDTGTGNGNDGPRRQPPPASTKKDLRSRYKEKIELFKEIYGEDDEDRARDKAMSLAMLGLAIAAGQSPDALTNIAQGAMVGLQGMSEQEQAQREREQGLRGLALETAIGDIDREAAAEESRLDREARLAIAGARSGGGAEKSRAEYRYNEVFKQTYESLVNPDPLSGRQPVPVEEAVRQAQSAAQRAAPSAPSAQVPGGPAPEPGPAPNQSTAGGVSEEDAAKALGF